MCAMHCTGHLIMRAAHVHTLARTSSQAARRCCGTPACGAAATRRAPFERASSTRPTTPRRPGPQGGSRGPRPRPHLAVPWPLSLQSLLQGHHRRRRLPPPVPPARAKSGGAGAAAVVPAVVARPPTSRLQQQCLHTNTHEFEMQVRRCAPPHPWPLGPPSHWCQLPTTLRMQLLQLRRSCLPLQQLSPSSVEPLRALKSRHRALYPLTSGGCNSCSW